MTHITKKSSIALIAFSIVLFTISARAAGNGELDTTFGTGGKATVDFDGNPTAGQPDQDSGLDMAIQPDGKIIIVGESNIASLDSVFSATRLNADGTIDTTFGTNGRFMYNFAMGIAERAYGVAIQSDGKILIAGRTNSPRDRVVIRLNTNGTIDTSFGNGGIFKIGIGSPTFDEPELVIQPDGKIVIVGTTRGGSLTSDAFSVIRLNSDGTPDSSFDSDGEVVTQFSASDRAYSVLLQPDGKIVVSGSTNNNGAMAFARYNVDGSLDATFGTDGKVTSTFPSATTIAYNMTLQSDGKILASGYARTTNTDAVLVRYNADGSVDTTFGNDGVASFGNTSNEIFWDVHIKGGKIIATGNRSLSSPGSPDDFMIVRFGANGTLDTSFGNSGVVYTDFSTSRDISLTSAFQSNGKLVLAGYTTSGVSFNPDFAAARYNFTPKDAFVDFDGDGKTDPAIMRASGIGATYQWWILNSIDGRVTSMPFGVRPRDVPAPADYDGDGKDDIAVWRNTPVTGEVCAFYIVYSSTGELKIIPFGQTGDTPVVEDYDGDGIDDLSVWRAPSAASGPGQATWFVRMSANNPAGNITYVPWGMRYGTQSDQVDEPYPGDFDGDGKADFTLQRRVDTSVTSSATPGMFYILTSSGQLRYEYFGQFGDRILPGDYDGDGKTDICVARGFNTSPGVTTWYVRYSTGIADSQHVFGSGFNFAQGDYDGDGSTDIAYFMTNTDDTLTGFWYLASSANREARFIKWGTRPTVPLSVELPIAVYNNR